MIQLIIKTDNNWFSSSDVKSVFFLISHAQYVINSSSWHHIGWYGTIYIYYSIPEKYVNNIELVQAVHICDKIKDVTGLGTAST